jgi:hypothetical protein
MQYLLPANPASPPTIEIITEKLFRALAPFLFDGSECFRTINAELRGPENEIAASNVRHAVLSQYRNTIPADVVIEVVLALREEV